MKQYSDDKKVDEIFVGNHTPEHDLAYLTGVEYRLGDQGFDIHGKELDRSCALPLFVKESSYNRYNQIKEAQLKAIRAGLKYQ